MKRAVIALTLLGLALGGKGWEFCRCPSDYSGQVCGSDFKTYDSECLMLCSGAELLWRGPCFFSSPYGSPVYSPPNRVSLNPPEGLVVPIVWPIYPLLSSHASTVYPRYPPPVYPETPFNKRIDAPPSNQQATPVNRPPVKPQAPTVIYPPEEPQRQAPSVPPIYPPLVIYPDPPVIRQMYLPPVYPQSPTVHSIKSPVVDPQATPNADVDQRINSPTEKHTAPIVIEGKQIKQKLPEPPHVQRIRPPVRIRTPSTVESYFPIGLEQFPEVDMSLFELLYRIYLFGSNNRK